MEDRAIIQLDPSEETDMGDFIAVFDGHGGFSVSQYAKEQLIDNSKTALTAMQQRCEQEQQCEADGIANALIKGFVDTDAALLASARQSIAHGRPYDSGNQTNSSHEPPHHPPSF